MKRKNLVRFGGSPRRRKALRRYVKKYSGRKMRGARTALHSGIVRQLEHDVRLYKKRGLKAWLFGNPIRYEVVEIDALDRASVLRTGLTQGEARAKLKMLRAVYGKSGLRFIMRRANQRNVQMGFKDQRGKFHPIRASKDYDEERSWSGGLERERKGMMREAPAARKFISAFMRREMKGRKVSPKKRGQLLAIAMSKVRARGMKVPPRRNPGGLAKVYDKVVSISTDIGLIRPQRKTAIYGDTRDRRRLVLKGERFNKQLEGAKVYEVEATGNTTKRNDVAKGDNFYHPFRVSAAISKDKAGHLVIRGSRPLWTPRTY